MPQFHDLLGNPFYEKHDHELVGVNRKQLMKEIIDEMQSVLESRSPYILCLLGSVGIGKSFTLMQLVSALNQGSQSKARKKIVAVKFDASIAGPPSKYIEYLFHSSMRALGQDRLIALRADLESGENDLLGNHETLKGIEQNFRNAFLNFGNPARRSVIWSWLIGEPVSSKELKNLGIVSKIDNPSRALDAFSNFCRILGALGYSGLILCIDEAEEIAISGTATLVKALTQIKKIMEQNKNELSETSSQATPIIMCLSFTPGTYELITGTHTAEKESERTGRAGLQTFLRRIGREYSIDPLSSDDMKELTKMFLDGVRKKKTRSIEPFDESAVKYLTEISRGIPGYFIGFAKELLKKADERKEPKITQEKANGWLVEEGLIPIEGIASPSKLAKEVEI